MPECAHKSLCHDLEVGVTDPAKPAFGFEIRRDRFDRPQRPPGTIRGAFELRCFLSATLLFIAPTHHQGWDEQEKFFQKHCSDINERGFNILFTDTGVEDGRQSLTPIALYVHRGMKKRQFRLESLKDDPVGNAGSSSDFASGRIQSAFQKEFPCRFENHVILNTNWSGHCS